MAQRTTITTGDCVADLEARFARRTQTRHAIVMNSGTSALHSAYFAAGVQPGDEVIVPTYTFYASASAILPLGGVPVFCDIHPQTLTADPEDVEKRITPRTRAICVVHVWGNPARMDRFVEIARRHDLTLIEDCSHAHGATFRDRPVGGWGDIGCFSMQGAKPVSGGELGVAVTNDATLHDHMLALGQGGRTLCDQKADTYDVDASSLGLKYRPHPYAVLLALASLERLDELNRLRRRNYQILAEELALSPAIQTIPTYPEATRGGLLEFIFRFNPQHANGITAGHFAKAVAAEGVPLQRDRYTLLGRTGRLLHELPLFNQPDAAPVPRGGLIHGAPDGAGDDPPRRPNLPVAEALADRLFSLLPLTDVSPAAVRACARAIKKVADTLPTVSDYRIGA